MAADPPILTERLTRESHRAEQRTRGAKRSAEVRREKNIERDRRVRAARDAGQDAKAIASAERTSVSQVNRILARPRP